MAKRTENVTVPISWYLPSRYDGNFLFISRTNVKLFVAKYKVQTLDSPDQKMLVLCKCLSDSDLPKGAYFGLIF